MAIRTPTPPGRPPAATEPPRQEVFGVPVGGTGTLQGNVESLHRQLNNLLGMSNEGGQQRVFGVPVGGTGTLQGNVESLHRQMNALDLVGKARRNIPSIAGIMGGGLIGGGLSAALSKRGKGRDTSATSGAGAIGSVATPAAVPAPSAQQVADPLSLQMFFTNTIAPYLEQLRASMAGTTGNIANQMQGMVGQAPANMRGLFNPNAQAGQANTLATALAGATAAGPTLDNLMAQIQQAAEMQRFAAYQAMKQEAGVDSANALGVMQAMLAGAKGEGNEDPLGLMEAANQATKKK